MRSGGMRRPTDDAGARAIRELQQLERMRQVPLKDSLQQELFGASSLEQVLLALPGHWRGHSGASGGAQQCLVVTEKIGRVKLLYVQSSSLPQQQQIVGSWEMERCCAVDGGGVASVRECSLSFRIPTTTPPLPLPLPCVALPLPEPAQDAHHNATTTSSSSTSTSGTEIVTLQFFFDNADDKDQFLWFIQRVLVECLGGEGKENGQGEDHPPCTFVHVDGRELARKAGRLEWESSFFTATLGAETLTASLAASGRQSLILSGKEVDEIALLSEDLNIGRDNAAKFTERLNEEVSRLETAIIADIMNDTSSVSEVITLLDETARKLSSLSGWLEERDVFLSQVRKDVELVERKNNIMEIQKENQLKLLSTIQKILEVMSISPEMEEICESGTLLTREGRLRMYAVMCLIHGKMHSSLSAQVKEVQAVVERMEKLQGLRSKLLHLAITQLDGLFTAIGAGHKTRSDVSASITAITASTMHAELEVQSDLLLWITRDNPESASMFRRRYAKAMSTFYRDKIHKYLLQVGKEAWNDPTLKAYKKFPLLGATKTNHSYDVQHNMKLLEKPCMCWLDAVQCVVDSFGLEERIARAYMVPSQDGSIICSFMQEIFGSLYTQLEQLTRTVVSGDRLLLVPILLEIRRLHAEAAITRSLFLLGLFEKLERYCEDKLDRYMLTQATSVESLKINWKLTTVLPVSVCLRDFVLATQSLLAQQNLPFLSTRTLTLCNCVFLRLAGESTAAVMPSKGEVEPDAALERERGEKESMHSLPSVSADVEDKERYKDANMEVGSKGTHHRPSLTAYLLRVVNVYYLQKEVAPFISDVFSQRILAMLDMSVEAVVRQGWLEEFRELSVYFEGMQHLCQVVQNEDVQYQPEYFPSALRALMSQFSLPRFETGLQTLHKRLGRIAGETSSELWMKIWEMFVDYVLEQYVIYERFVMKCYAGQRLSPNSEDLAKCLESLTHENTTGAAT